MCEFLNYLIYYSVMNYIKWYGNLQLYSYSFLIAVSFYCIFKISMYC